MSFKFSIIMAVYNVENYIREAVDSVINQTLPFEKYTEIILVNDGSPDNSDAICREYEEKYPDNIKYIKKENGGVSSARNAGIEAATGEYLNFLDPDDYFTSETLESVYGFIKAYGDKIDLVSIPMHCFGAKEYEHALNWKFKSTRVVDIKESPNSLQLSSSSSFVNKVALKGACFNTDMKYAEDSKLINQVILDKCKYGVVCEAGYMYRKRDDGSSAMQSAFHNAKYYTDVVRYLDDLVEDSLGRYGEVLEYVGCMIYYELKWLLRAPEVYSDVFTEAEFLEYNDKLSRLMDYVSEEICSSNHAPSEAIRYYMIERKYNKPINKLVNVHCSEDDIFFGIDKCFFNYGKQFPILISQAYYEKNALIIRGSVNQILDNHGTVFIELERKDNSDLHPLRLKVNEASKETCFGKAMDYYCDFTNAIKFSGDSDKVKIRYGILIEGRKYYLNLEFINESGLINSEQCSYGVAGGYLFIKRKYGIQVLPYNEEREERAKDRYETAATRTLTTTMLYD